MVLIFFKGEWRRTYGARRSFLKSKIMNYIYMKKKKSNSEQNNCVVCYGLNSNFNIKFDNSPLIKTKKGSFRKRNYHNLVWPICFL